MKSWQVVRSVKINVLRPQKVPIRRLHRKAHLHFGILTITVKIVYLYLCTPGTKNPAARLPPGTLGHLLLSISFGVLAGLALTAGRTLCKSPQTCTVCQRAVPVLIAFPVHPVPATSPAHTKSQLTGHSVIALHGDNSN